MPKLSLTLSLPRLVLALRGLSQKMSKIQCLESGKIPAALQNNAYVSESQSLRIVTLSPAIVSVL